jgi:uncharacterized integral membrane protein
MKNNKTKWIVLLALVAGACLIYYFLVFFFPANQTGLTDTYLKAKFTLEATLVVLGIGIVKVFWNIFKKGKFNDKN